MESALGAQWETKSRAVLVEVEGEGGKEEVGEGGARRGLRSEV